MDESDEELDGDGVEGLDDDSHDVLAGEDEKSLESTEEVSDELEIESDVQDDVDEVESEDELEEDSEVSGDETTQTTEATDVRESEDFASDSLEGPESELGEAREEMSDDVEIFEHPDVASVTLSVRSHEFFETADFLLDIDEMQMDEFLVDLTEGVLDASEESTDEETETAGGIQE